MPQIEERIFRVVSETSGIELESVHAGSNIEEDLQMDEMDVLELIMALEDEFGIAIEDGDIEEDWVTVADIVDFIKKQKIR